MLVKTVDLVDHAVDVLVEMGLEILEVNARLHAGLHMGDAADIAAVHGEDGGEEIFTSSGLGVPLYNDAAMHSANRSLQM